MKKHIIWGIILFASFLFNSCSEQKKNEKTKNTTSNPFIEETLENENDVLYTMNGNCDDFIARLDFSSFCLTNKKTPKYRLVQNTDTNCQFQLYDDKEYQNIDFSIVFSDFEKPMKKDAEPNPAMAKMLFKTFFKKNIQRRMLKNEKEIPNLGDEAYIGFSEKKDEQVLGVRAGNVSFRFIFHHGKEIAQQSCMQAEDDLKKLGQMIVENIAK